MLEFVAKVLSYSDVYYMFIHLRVYVLRTVVESMFCQLLSTPILWFVQYVHELNSIRLENCIIRHCCDSCIALLYLPHVHTLNRIRLKNCIVRHCCASFFAILDPTLSCTICS